MNLVIEIAVLLLPSMALLLAFFLMDSYKLMGIKSVVTAVFFGALTAIVSYFVNTPIAEIPGLDWRTYSRYGAPLVEEFYKGAILIYFIRINKIGFNIDAAIYGFALGAGFSIMENLYYMTVLDQETNLGVFFIRGFGTAIMHGGTTTLFGIISKTMIDRKIWGVWGGFFPGFLTASVYHSNYNHFYFNPILFTVVTMVTLPLILMVILKRSEAFLQNWLGVGFDTDQDLLDMVNKGNVSDTNVGQYLKSVKDRFPREVVFDMICLLKIHLELSMRAKGVLMMRETGMESELDPDIQDKFNELRYLEKNIGKVGMLVLSPFLHKSRQDLWQIHMLDRKMKG